MTARRRAALSGLVCLAVVAVGAELVLAFGWQGRFAFVSLHDYRRPLLVGAIAASTLLIVSFDHRWWRRSTMAMLAVLGLLGAINFGRYSPAMITEADIAVGEVSVELATRGNLFVGAYSRFGWQHPGPLASYVTAPFYVVSGRRAPALYSAATAINVLCLVALTWIVGRMTRDMTAAIVTVACAVFVWRLNWFLASPWNAHIGVLPALLFVVAAAAVASGRFGLWPVMAIAGSFAVQAHVGFLPLVAALTLIVTGWIFARPATWGSAVRSVRGALWCLLILWALPIAQALTNQGGNLLALWRFFVAEGGAAHSLHETFLTGCYALMGIVRPDFDLPWGAHFELTYLTWCVPAAVVEVVALVVLTRWHAIHERSFEAWLAGCALVATVVCVWSLSRVRGDILIHEPFRLAAIGGLNLGILAAGLWRAIGGRVPAAFIGATVTRTVTAIVLVIVAALAVRDLEAFTSFELRRERGRVRAVEAHAALSAYLDRHGFRKPLIVIGPDRYSEAATVLLRLTQQGRDAAVDDVYVGMFSEAFRRTGDEDVTVVFADLDQHRRLRERPGTTVLFEALPLFVDVTSD